MSDYPVGKAQQKVLDALGVRRSTFASAEAYFAEIGIVVSSKRVGRSSEPVVRINPRHSGGWNIGGDGDSWREYADLTPNQLAALAPWIVK